MKPAPMFLFACAVAAVSGAVGGAAIDTTPLQRAGIGTPGYLYEPATFAVSDEPLAQPALPDHYDMLTPSGRVQVAELTTYGLRSQRRFGWSEPPPLEPLRPIVEQPGAEAGWRRTADFAVHDSQPSAEPLPADANGAAAPAGPAADTGSARMINVAAALADG